MSMPLNILCYYARKDQPMLTHLITHLTPFQTQGKITLWSKININAGKKRQEEFDRHLANADIILLFISGDFIASGHYRAEMKQVIARHDSAQTPVIPILLDLSHREEEPFAPFQVVPRSEIPVSQWVDINAAFYDITTEIMLVVDAILAERKKVQPLFTLPQYPRISRSNTATVPDTYVYNPNTATVPDTPAKPPVEVVSVPLPGPSAGDPAPNRDLHTATPLPHWPGSGGHFQNKKKRWLLLGLPIVLILGIIFVPLLQKIINPQPLPPPAPIGQQSVPLGDGESVRVGISDGSFFFRTQNELNTYKLAGEADGENCIYNENHLIFSSLDQVPYLTVVAVVSLSDTKADHTYSFGLGNATLQGFCQKQIAYNSDPVNTVKVRILVANIGVQRADVLQKTMPLVTQQIIQFAHQDQTFIGTAGFTYSASLDDHNPGYTINTMDQLMQAGIPAISTAAAASDSTFVTRWAGYFYRMNPDNDAEANVAAHYAYARKNKKTAFVFYDSISDYSRSLGISFMKYFQAIGGTLNSADIHDSQFNQSLAALNANPPDLIFCACVAASTSPDFSIFAQDLKHYSNLAGGKVMVMGADGLFNPEGRDIAYSNMFFTALAFPDALSNLCTSDGQCSSEQLQFYQDYCLTFAPQAYEQNPGLPLNKKCPTYGLSRPAKSTMLAYDALSTLLLAYVQHLSSSASLLENVRQALPEVSFQGITGWIQLSNITSNPVHKMIVVVSVDDRGFGSEVAYCGKFTPAVSDYTLSPQQDC